MRKLKKMKRKNIVYVTVSLLIMVFLGTYFYYGFLYKEARNIATETPDLNVSASKLFSDYNADPAKADVIYLNKTVQITAEITKKTDSVIVLENTVFCRFTQKNKEKIIGNTVTIKGKCIGYDDLFQEVKLDQCSINKQNN